MMINYWLKFLLIGFIVLNSASAYSIQSVLLDTKNKLENEIQENLTDLIATRLDKATFTVAARVQLKGTPGGQSGKENEENKKELEKLPAGMDIGAIDVREIIASYERQLEEIKILKESQKEKSDKTEDKFDTTKIEIFVGLDETTYPDKYISEFSSWLSKRAKAEYGLTTKTEVTKLKMKELEQKIKADQRSEEALDQLKRKDFLNFISVVLILLGLILLGWLIKSGLSINGTSKKDLNIDGKSEVNSSNDNKDGEGESELNDDLSGTDSKDLDKILGKIAFVCLELGKQVNNLVRVWIDSGDSGYLKAALLVDTLMAAREKIMSTTGSLPALAIPIDPDIVSSQEENLAEAYRQVSIMSIADRRLRLEEIYWDLISVKTLGLQSLRRPFDFMQSLSKEQLVKTIQAETDDVKALTLMYLPESVQNEYLNNIEDTEKEKILFQMLSKNQISQKEIWSVDASIKSKLMNTSGEAIEKLVNLFPRMLEVLQNLEGLAEISLLRKTVLNLADSGLVLKQNYVTLAFITEWKSDYIKRLVGVATNSELVNLILAIPDAKENILSMCSDKVKIIVEDDLKIITTKDDSEINKSLKTLKQKWQRIVQAENISMSKVVQTQLQAQVVENVA